MPPSAELIRIGFLASLVAGLATGAGALPVLFTREVSDRILDVMLGFAAGVMLAATAFSLLLPAIELGGIWIAVLGTVIGGLFLHLVDRFTPHLYFISGPEGPSSNLRRIWLLILAITIHNFPEGLGSRSEFWQWRYEGRDGLGYRDRASKYARGSGGGLTIGAGKISPRKSALVRHPHRFSGTYWRPPGGIHCHFGTAPSSFGPCFCCRSDVICRL